MREKRVNMGVVGRPITHTITNTGFESVTEWFLVRVQVREQLGSIRTPFVTIWSQKIRSRKL